MSRRRSRVRLGQISILKFRLLQHRALLRYGWGGPHHDGVLRRAGEVVEASGLTCVPSTATLWQVWWFHPLGLASGLSGRVYHHKHNHNIISTGNFAGGFIEFLMDTMLVTKSALHQGKLVVKPPLEDQEVWGEFDPALQQHGEVWGGGIVQ